MLEAPVQVLNQLGLDRIFRAVNEVEANSMRIAGSAAEGLTCGGWQPAARFRLSNDESSLEGFGSWFSANCALPWKTGEHPQKIGYRTPFETLEAMLADAYRASFGRPVIDSELSRKIGQG